MKLSKKVIALLLVLSIVLSVVIPISVSNAAPARIGNGMNATIYRAESYIGGRNLVTGGENGANFDELNKQFDATIDGLIDASALVSTEPGVSGIRTKGGDWNIVRWTGTMTADIGGDYTILAHKIDNGFVMFVDGVKVFEYWGAYHWFDTGADRLLSDLGSFTVVAGQIYDVEMYYLEIDGGEALDIYATTTPFDLESGAPINDTFTFNLTEEWYLNLDTNGNMNDAIGNGTGNKGNCADPNLQYDESIDTLLSHMSERSSKVVSSFGDAVYGDDRYVIMYDGVLVPKTTGTYTFSAVVDNGFYMKIAGTTVYEMWAGGTWTDGRSEAYPTGKTLTAGQAYPFKAAFLEIDGGEGLNLTVSLNGAAAVAVNDLFTFYPASSPLDFSLNGVNLLSGAETIDSDSELTIQYTDATLGDNIEMFATITDKDGNELVKEQRIVNEKGNSFLRVVHKTGLFEANEAPNQERDVYSAAAGSVTFKPALTGTYNVSDLKITIWTQVWTGDDGFNPNFSSNKATTTINNGFTKDESFVPNPTEWMNYIDGSTLLSQINLPGTHDSGTQYINAVNYNKCQDSSIADQLGYGVRYLDLRADMYHLTEQLTISEEPEIKVTNFGISHSTSAAYIDDPHSRQLSFNDVYQTCKTFLNAHPSECIVIGINDENMNDGDDKKEDGEYEREDLINALHTFVTADPTLFYTKGNEIPTLDDVRGKIVIFRRFPGRYTGEDNSFIDFFWKDKSKGEEESPIIPVSNGSNFAVTTYFVQDHYSANEIADVSTLSINTKWNVAKTFLDQAAKNKEANQYYINFFSMAFTMSGSTPKSSANTINANFYDDTKTPLIKGEQYGWLLFDYIDYIDSSNTKHEYALTKKVYNTNIFLKEPQLVVDEESHQIVSDKKNKVVVHYDFADIENNTVIDLQENGFDGTMKNTNLLDTNSIYNTVSFNNAGRNTDRGAGYISIPRGVFNGTGDTATIQVWLRDTGTAVRDNWLTVGRNVDAVRNNWFIANTKWDGGGVRYSVKSTKVLDTDPDENRDNREIQTWSSNDNVDSQWHLLTYVLNGDNIKIYVDNNSTPVVNDKMNANFNDMDPGIFVDSAVYLGAASYWTDNDAFVGSMGDFTIYNYAVDTTAIADTYAELAEEYTYITKATLGGKVTAVATEDLSGNNFIFENYEDEGSVIYFTTPSSYDVTKAKLALEIDGSKVEISVNGGEWQTFDETKEYNLSSNVQLKVTSLNDNREKVYDVVVNGIVVKDYYTEEVVGALDKGTTTLPAKEAENYLFAGWYSEANNVNAKITTVDNLDVVYLRMIAAEAPVIAPESSRSIRVTNPNGIRFKASITRGEFYNYLFGEGHEYNYESDNGILEFGMLIVPSRFITNGELTYDTPEIQEVVGKKVFDQFNGPEDTNEGDLDYTGVIARLPETLYETELAARAYIKFKDSTGEERTLYSDVTAYGSYLGVAKIIYNTTNSNDDKALLESIFAGYNLAE